MLQYQKIRKHSQKSDKQPWFSLLSLHFSLLSLLFKKIWTLKTLVKVNKSKITGASPVAQWWRIRLPMQGPRVQSLVREDPTCCRATELGCPVSPLCPVQANGRETSYLLSLEPLFFSNSSFSMWGISLKEGFESLMYFFHSEMNFPTWFLLIFFF